MKVHFTRRARADLNDIYDYLCTESPRAAVDLFDRIVSSVESLVQMPRKGRTGRVPGTRELVVVRTGYIVIYAIDDVVTILSIRHGRQQWPSAS